MKRSHNGIPTQRQNGTIDVPSTGTLIHQGRSATEAAREELRIQEAGTMYDRLGTPRRRLSTSTHRYILDRQIKPAFIRLLRLRYRQTWRLPRNQELESNAQVPDEGRPGSPDFWYTPPVPGATLQGTSFSHPEDGTDCPTTTLWGELPAYPPGYAWLLHDEPQEDRGFRSSVCYIKRLEAEETLAWPHHDVLRPTYTEIVRMGELECVPTKSFPTSPTVLAWPPWIWENELPSPPEWLSQDLHDASG